MIALAAAITGAEGHWLSPATAAQALANRNAQAATGELSSIMSVQTIAVDAKLSVIRIQASRPLAFDRLKSKDSRQVIIRLYAAQLGDIPPFEQPAFGSVSFSDDGHGTVTVTINLSSSRDTAKVTQGGNPNTVEVRVKFPQ
jgi:hypothetical protein